MPTQIIEIDTDKQMIVLREQLEILLEIAESCPVLHVDDGDFLRAMRTKLAAAPRPEPVQPDFDPIVPEHALIVGANALELAMQSGITSPRTLALVAYTDIALTLHKSKQQPARLIQGPHCLKCNGTGYYPVGSSNLCDHRCAPLSAQQPAASNYTAADMASQAAHGFRDGVESVSKKPAQPIPTAERLPTAADADEFGFLIAYHAEDKRWRLWHSSVVLSRVYEYSYWLPTGLARPAEPTVCAECNGSGHASDQSGEACTYCHGTGQ